ncbi:MAG: polysaccharide biosynthesis tyrosine autokinase [Wenzhouxiangella sp.]|nr:MAG: polysaccharide biosynthesis tyrosine autokinase [Wenzhouxiangella sp.]
MHKDKDSKPHHHLQPVQAGKGQMAVYDPLVNAGFDDDDTIDLRDYWRILVKRRWTVLAVIAIVVVAALLATLLMIPEYRSTAQLQVSPTSGRVLAFDDFANDPAMQGRGFQEYMNSQIEILRSRTLAEQVVRRENLANHPELNGDIRQRSVLGELRSVLGTVRGAIGPDDAAGEANSARDPVEAAARRLRQRIEIQPVRNSQLLNVSVSSFDREFAALVTNALVAQFIRNNLQRRIEAGTEAREFLEEQLADMRITLERSDEALMDFARDTNIADLDERLSMARTALRRLGDRQSEVQAELVQISAWRDLIDQGRTSALDPIVNSPVIEDLERRLLEANTEYTRLSATFQDQFPRVQEVLGRIAQLEQEIEDRKTTIIENILARHDNLTAQDASLATAIGEREGGILALNERAVQYNILRREFETSRELYDGLLQRMKEVGVAAGVQENNLSIIDAAQAAMFPFKPNLPRNLALALVLGVMGGVGLALLLEFLDSSIRRVEDIERLVDRPVLGMVPLVKVKDREGKQKKRPEIIEDPEQSISFYSKTRPSSGVSEAFRSLRTSLGFSTAEGMPRTLMVTSSAMAEGKTTSAVNLATVLAQNNHRVLLIDADLRKSRLHREFNRPRSPGLTNRIALFENNGKDNGAISPTFIDNLFLMPSGNSTPSPAEMLSSDRLGKVIEGCKRAFDYVIIDAPPVLGLADSLILSRRVEGVIFVAKAGTTGKENFRVCMKRLAQVQAPVLGIILNGVDLDSPEYAYYSSYYYNYEGDSDDTEEDAPKLRQTAT